MQEKNIVLTGDRPSGLLHLGHYVGSLSNRLQLQEKHIQYILIADVQALTDNFENPQKVQESVFQIALDYLSVGIDPHKSTIFIQSLIPEIAELTIFYMNLVTINRLKRNPTIKAEIHQKGYGEQVTAGFLLYPVHQAADITIVKGTLIPVGEDQLPMIEQTNEIVRTFNRIYHTNVLVEAEPLISSVPRLPGIDGKSKMGKSLGNAIFLSDSPDSVAKKVMSMYTDSHHIRIEDPGNVEHNTVFAYLDIFDNDRNTIQEMKAHYQRGGLGDVTVKKRLIEVLNAFLDPIRTRRAYLEQHSDYIKQVLREGTGKVREVACNTMNEVKSVMSLYYA